MAVGGRGEEREQEVANPFHLLKSGFLVIPTEDTWGQSPWRRPGLPDALAVLSWEKEIM